MTTNETQNETNPVHEQHATKRYKIEGQDNKKFSALETGYTTKTAYSQNW